MLKRTMGDQRGIATSLGNIAQLAVEHGTPDLLPVLYEGLALSLEIVIIPITLEILTIVGRWAVPQQGAEAARLAGMIHGHAATSAETRLVLSKLLQELEAQLPAAQLATLMTEGAALDPIITARVWLARLKAALE